MESQLSDMSDFQKMLRDTETSINIVKEEHNSINLAASKIEDVLKNKQNFLAKMDAEKRKHNLIINGVSEHEPLAGLTNDEDKCLHLFHRLGFKELSKMDYTVSRIKDVGNALVEKKVRPILVTFKNVENQKLILLKSFEMNENPAPYNTIHIKRDTHPVVKKEWERLQSVYDKAMKEFPGHITFDEKARVIEKDGIIIDKWQANF